MANLLSSARDNLAFLGVCALVTAGIVLLALLAERLFIRDRHILRATRTVAFVALFAAIAAVLSLLEIPLFFAPSFYKLDLSEIPVLICAFYLGPVAGVVCEALKVVLYLLLKGTTTAFVGDFANFVVGCTLVLPASILYHLHKSKRNAVCGLALGTAVMTVFGSLFNALYLIPKFAELFGLPLDEIVAMGAAVNPLIGSLPQLVLYAVVPFNIVKGVVVSVLTFALYKRVERLLIQK